MKKFLAAVFLALACAPAFAAERVVNVYNWSDYIDPGVLEDFTRETGIKVVYDTYDSNEMLESHLLAGRTGYDIVVPSATFLERQIKAGVLQPIDRSKLANAGNIWSEIDGSPVAIRPRQRPCRELHVVHDRRRLQCREDQGAPRQSRSRAGIRC